MQSFSALHKLCVISHAGIILPKQPSTKAKCNKRRRGRQNVCNLILNGINNFVSAFGRAHRNFPLLIIFNKIFYSGTLGDNQSSARHHENFRSSRKNLIRFSVLGGELSIPPAAASFSISLAFGGDCLNCKTKIVNF